MAAAVARAAAAAAAGPEQDGAAAGNRSWRRRSRGSWRGGRRGRQVGVKSWAGTRSAAARGVWQLWLFSPAPTPFALERGYRRRVVPALRPKRADGGRPPNSCLSGSGALAVGAERGASAPPSAGRRRGEGTGRGWVKKEPRRLPRFSPWLALKLPGLPFPGLDQGYRREGSKKSDHKAEQQFPRCVWGYYLSFLPF